mmetsp:Transcript_866/g.2428  ORF Transcript_866/g.2428 Transcript_866/m.2428 type:complete len:313 (+) Transcript_866:170-1108(+)
MRSLSQKLRQNKIILGAPGRVDEASGFVAVVDAEAEVEGFAEGVFEGEEAVEEEVAGVAGEDVGLGGREVEVELAVLAVDQNDGGGVPLAYRNSHDHFAEAVVQRPVEVRRQKCCSGVHVRLQRHERAQRLPERAFGFPDHGRDGFRIELGQIDTRRPRRRHLRFHVLRLHGVHSYALQEIARARWQAEGAPTLVALVAAARPTHAGPRLALDLVVHLTQRHLDLEAREARRKRRRLAHDRAIRLEGELRATSSKPFRVALRRPQRRGSRALRRPSRRLHRALRLGRLRAQPRRAPRSLELAVTVVRHVHTH